MPIKNVKSNEFVLKATCPAMGGIVASVTSFLWSKSCYISELNQFDDPDTGRFFMRLVCRVDDNGIEIEQIQSEFASIAKEFDMKWDIFDRSILSPASDTFKQEHLSQNIILLGGVLDERFRDISDHRGAPSF